MHMQTLKLLRPAVLVEMYLQENTVFDLDLGIKVTWNIAKHPLHHVTYAYAKSELVTPNRLGRDVFTKKYSIWPWHKGHLKCAQYPLHHVTYTAASLKLLRFMV